MPKIEGIHKGKRRVAKVFAKGNAGTALSSGVTDIDFTEVTDTNDAWNGTTYTVQKTGSVIQINGQVLVSSSNANTVNMYVNGVYHRRVGELNDQNITMIADTAIDLQEGDQVSFRWTSGNTLSNDVELHWISIVEEWEEQAA